MKTISLWKAIEYNSLENCVLTRNKNGLEVNSVIIGYSDKKIFRADYFLKINPVWEIFFAEIKFHSAGTTINYTLEKTAERGWLLNDKEQHQFNDCIDIDITLSPFTNTLPVNRLRFQEGQEHIKVIYFDLLSGEVKPVLQCYTRLSAFQYKFENVPNDFEAVLDVDNNGLVINYPRLFKRISVHEE